MKTSKPKTLEIIYHDLRPSKKKILGKGFHNNYMYDILIFCNTTPL